MPDGACRDGSPSSSRRSWARARRRRTEAGEARMASSSPLGVRGPWEDMLTGLAGGTLAYNGTTVTFAVIVAAGYLLGSCPWGYWLVRLFHGEDIRSHG